MKFTHYIVVCFKCGDGIQVYHEKYAEGVEAGKVVYYHVPSCPLKVSEEDLYSARAQMACF